MKPEQTLDYHFRKNWHGIARLYNQMASKHGFSMSAGFTLLSIDKNGTPSTQLGPKMGMESRSLTRILKSMESEGLIQKKNDEQDKRVVRIQLTDKGKKARKQSRDVVVSFNEQVQSKIQEEDLETFFKVCNQIGDYLESISIDNA